MQPPLFRAERHVWLAILRSEWQYARSEAEVALAMPNFAIREELERTLGLWDARTRTIHLSARLLDARYWRILVETLRHEMAHQIVSEAFLEPGDRTHGEAFARACRMLKIRAAATARPEDLVGSDDEPPVVRKIRKLLALSGSSNQFEAEAALRKALELAMKHDVDLGSVESRDYGYRLLDGPRRRWPRYTWQILGIVSKLHEIRYIEISTLAEGSLIEIFGVRANLDLAEYAFHYLRNTGERVWEEHRRVGGAPGGAGRKASFLEGLYQGFSDKLESQRREIERSTALVRREDPRLTEFYRARHPRVSLRSIGAGRLLDDEAHDAGRRAGAELRLNSGLRASGPTRGLLE